MANIKDYIKKLNDGTVSSEEQQKALVEIEKTIVEQKQKRDEAVGKNAQMVVDALRKIEERLNAKLVELNNTPAKQGVQGPQGPAGKDGRDGVDGYKGADGKDGVDGLDGKDGKDGVSIVDAYIDFDGALVIKLSNGNEINAGDVVPLDVKEKIHIASTNGGGTSQSVLDAIDAINATIATYGTMALQNANNVNISGGSINNTPIGATTPNTVTATTLTAQTEVLKGTGQNLFTYSEQFDNAAWFKSDTTVTANAIAAPDGTTTADKIVETATTNTHYVSQGTLVSGLPYVFSFYAKAAERTLVSMTGGGFAGQGFNVRFDLTNGTVSTNTGSKGFIQSAGNGWYRCYVAFTTSATSGFGINLVDGSGNVNYLGVVGNGLYVWGAQLEVGSTINTYLSTTTTAVYGTPSLSFSGVAGLGLQSDGSLYVSPAGAGAIQAQATTSSITGGNARGVNAVDWQTNRSAATMVASGAQSVVGGGAANTASSTFATVAGGNGHTASGFGSTIGGGNGNIANNTYAVVAGGQANLATQNRSAILGGESNSALGFFNTIVGGAINSGTANAAVTTQATTTVTSGSAAVTLSGSNASIKVGQLITGTGIVTSPYTYVAAISGTALTLSQNANATGTPTLSFFTPHGVVVGGGNNQATGAYSFIGGGGDAGTAANRNTASGAWSTIGGGFKNTASNIGSVVCGGGTYDGTSSGGGNTSSGLASFVGAGWNNIASSDAAHILGAGCIANAAFSTAIGEYASTRAISGNFVISPSVAPLNAVYTNQVATLVLARQTTDATATVLTSTTSAASTTNQVILPNNAAYYFTGEIVAGVTGGGNTKGWKIEGVIKRGANAASTAIVGTATVTSAYADAGAAAWTVAVAADTTNGGLKITVTGAAATTIRWVAQVRTTEMTY